jgi:hypothetical protein
MEQTETGSPKRQGHWRNGGVVRRRHITGPERRHRDTGWLPRLQKEEAVDQTVSMDVADINVLLGGAIDSSGFYLEGDQT